MLVESETSGLMLTLRQVPCLFVQRNHLCLISKWSLRCFHTTHWSYHEKNCNPWNIFTCLGFKCCSSKQLANGNALSQSWQVINATINLPCSFQPCITFYISSDFELQDFDCNMKSSPQTNENVPLPFDLYPHVPAFGIWHSEYKQKNWKIMAWLDF